MRPSMGSRSGSVSLSCAGRGSGVPAGWGASSGGAAKAQFPAAWRLMKIQVPEETQPVNTQTFQFKLRTDKLRQVRRREGRYLLRSNLSGEDPARPWQFYIQLTQVEAAFKDLKDDLSLRPIFHPLEHRIEAHIFVAFLAYCLHVSWRSGLRVLAPGLTPRSVLEKFASIQMLDVHFPTTDGRELVFCRYTQPEKDHQMLLAQLGFVSGWEEGARLAVSAGDGPNAGYQPAGP